MDMRGHNSAAYGEEMRERVETVLGDDHETVFHYVQWHIGDYIAGTEGMPLETEGAYMRFLSRLYRRGKPLPDDDRFMSVCMDLSIRVWKRVKEVLISVGKIICRNGALTNARFEKERQRRAELIQKQSESARLRWEKQRAEKMGLAEVSPKFAGSLAETSGKLSQSISKKSNKINEPVLTDHMLTNNHYPITKKETSSDSEQEAARGTLDDIDGLNGATVFMQLTIAKWMNPYGPKHREAQIWLTSTVKMFGSDVVRDAFASVEAKHASGEIVGSPIKLMTAICQQKAAAQKAPTAKPEKKPENMPDFIWERLQADKAKALA